MDDTIGPAENEECKGPEDGNGKPPAGIGTEELEAALFNEIQYTSSACDGDTDAYTEVDENFSGEEDYEDDDERRCSVLRVLETMRS
jgi:hypothetical protein